MLRSYSDHTVLKTEKCIRIFASKPIQPFRDIEMFPTMKLRMKNSVINPLTPHLERILIGIIPFQRSGKKFIIIIAELVSFYFFEIRIG